MLLRSHLYAPGNNPKLLDKVWTAGADAVILDLEDSVPVGEKERARKLVAETLEQHAGVSAPTAFVRINHPSSPWAQEDVQAIVGRGLAGIRIPKVEDAETVRRVAGWVEAAQKTVGAPGTAIGLLPILESGLGIWRAFEIAASHPFVLCLSYGAADLTRDLGLVIREEELELLHVRSQLVLASRAAGVQAPVDTVFTRLDDAEGLERSAQRARALGFFGKGAIHPRQVPIINAVFTPTPDEIARAREIVSAAQDAADDGIGALRGVDGEFIDQAIVEQARGVLRLAEQLDIESRAE